MAKKIAYISVHSSPLDAAGNVQFGMPLDQLVALGCQVDVFTCRPADHADVVVQYKPQVRVIQVPVAGVACESEQSLNDFADFVVEYVGNEQRPYDLIHTVGSASGWVGMQVQRTLSLPLVAELPQLAKTERALGEAAMARRQLRLGIQQELIGQADLLVARCRQHATDLQTLCGAERDRIALVPYGIDAEAFAPLVRGAARDQVKWASHDFTLLHVLGTGLAGVEELIRAMAGLNRRFSVAARLCLAVPAGMNSASVDQREVERLKALASELEVEDQVLVTSWHSDDDLRTLYSAADAYVSASDTEPATPGVLRAMSCGLPVVALAESDAADLVREGETGFLVSRDHPDALAERLAALNEDPLRRFAFGTAARLTAVEQLSTGAAATRLAAVYDKVLSGPQRAARGRRTEKPAGRGLNVAV
ncbi:MAG: glycosyltransferase [Rhodocyclaceae bacterium]